MWMLKISAVESLLRMNRNMRGANPCPAKRAGRFLDHSSTVDYSQHWYSLECCLGAQSDFRTLFEAVLWH